VDSASLKFPLPGEPVAPLMQRVMRG
jgi:hypothetical protein